jgi:hypothetical protein
MLAMELQAGLPQKKGNQLGPTYAYNVKALCDQEMELAQQADAITHALSIVGERARRKARRASASLRQGTSRTPGGACSRYAALRHEVARATRK